jgi:hypothetical protein
MSDEPQPLSTEFAYKNIDAMRQGLDRHNATCGFRAEALLLHPYDHGLLRFDELWGIPVLPYDAVSTKRFRIRCAGPEEDEEGVLPLDD